MNLQTVTGLIPVEDVKLADAHAHIWINPPPDVDFDAPILDDTDAILTELNEIREAGVTTIIDCQPGGCGRDARMLVRLSQATGLHVAAVTGFHRQIYYPPKSWLWTAPPEQAADYFIGELEDGMNETGGTIRATVVKVGYEGVIDGQTKALMEAAAEAARQTGCAILFHTEAGANVESLLPFFSDYKIPPRRLYLCHMDKRPDFGLHRELAQAGVLLGYDTFLRPQYEPEQNLWPLLKQMVAAELGGQIALGLDAAMSSMWAQMGAEFGLLALPRLIVPRLRDEGIDKATVAGLTGQNVARFLVWQSVP
jgi:phosphotriesterase-related protein